MATRQSSANAELATYRLFDVNAPVGGYAPGAYLLSRNTSGRKSSEGLCLYGVNCDVQPIIPEFSGMTSYSRLRGHKPAQYMMPGQSDTGDVHYGLPGSDGTISSPALQRSRKAMFEEDFNLVRVPEHPYIEGKRWDIVKVLGLAQLHRICERNKESRISRVWMRRDCSAWVQSQERLYDSAVEHGFEVPEFNLSRNDLLEIHRSIKNHRIQPIQVSGNGGEVHDVYNANILELGLARLEQITGNGNLAWAEYYLNYSNEEYFDDLSDQIEYNSNRHKIRLPASAQGLGVTRFSIRTDSKGNPIYWVGGHIEYENRYGNQISDHYRSDPVDEGTKHVLFAATVIKI